jgi:hypothetical protein
VIAVALRTRTRALVAVGLGGLLATVVARPPSTPEVASGMPGLATTPYTRLFLILGTLVGVGLAVAGLAGGTRRDAPAVTLGTLGAAGLTMAFVDARAAVLVATAGGLFGVLVTLLPRGARAGATVGIREARAVVVAGRCRRGDRLVGAT